MQPSSKRRHTGHALVDNAAKTALGSSATVPAGQEPAVSAPMQPQEAVHIADAADVPAQVSTEAANIAIDNIQGLPPDNNAIVWEPLVVRVCSRHLASEDVIA
jgi:hypothetical protein